MSNAGKNSNPEVRIDILGDAGVEAMREEVKGLQDEARRLNMHTTTVALATLSIVSLGTTLIQGPQRPLAFLLAPLLLGAVATYQFNISAQASAVAEQRDRLYNVLNARLRFPIYLERSVADLRRGNIGTLGAYTTAGGTIIAAVGYCLIENWCAGPIWRTAQVVATVGAVGATLAAAVDFFRVRVDVNDALDELGLAWARPRTAPRASASLRERMRTASPDACEDDI